METLIFANTKGGVCKTHLAYHAAQHLVKKGKRVLCLDLDQQSHLVKLLRAEAPVTLFDVVTSNKSIDLKKCIYQKDNLYCVYSDLDLRNLDMYLIMVDAGREVVLRKLFKPYFEHFDYCIVDLPPGSNLTTTNAYAFPNVKVIVPVTLDHLSLLGVTNQQDFIDTYNENMEKGVQFHKIIICKDNVEISNHSHDAREWLYTNYNGKVCKANFPKSVHYVNSAANGVSLEKYFEENKNKKSDALIHKLDELFTEIVQD